MQGEPFDWVFSELTQSRQTSVKPSQGSKPRSHEGSNPVDPMCKATDDSGSENKQSTMVKVVRLHKPVKPVNSTAQATDDTRSGNESSQSSTVARLSVVQLQKGVNLVSPTFQGRSGRARLLDESYQVWERIVPCSI